MRLLDMRKADRKDRDRSRRGIWGSLKSGYAKAAAAAGLCLAMGAAGCGARTGLIDVYGDDGGMPSPDARADAGQDSGQDSAVDSGTDGGPVPPLPPNSLANLIGDHINRTLLDRSQNSHGDNDSSYPMGGSDTAANANPFTDGNGGSIGPNEEYLHRIGPSLSDALADVAFTDGITGQSFVERQSIWIRGDNHFDGATSHVVGRLDFLAYALKFDGPDGGEAGIPVCTDGLQAGACALPAYTVPEARRRTISFLGEEWHIIRMQPPEASVNAENLVVNGGSVMLAQEATRSLLTVGQHISIDGLSFTMHAIEEHEGEDAMALRVTDASGTVLHMDILHPGQMKEMTIGGDSYKLYLGMLGSDWADLSILSRTLELTDGQRLNADEGDNPGFAVALGWKNLNASASSDRPDSLRTIILYSDDIGDISTSGTRNLAIGDSVALVQDPALWRVRFQGLDLSSDDYRSLEIRLRASDIQVSPGEGPIVEGVQAGCVIRAPHLRFRSSEPGAVFEAQRTDAPGQLSDEEFYVSLSNGAACDADGDGSNETELGPGTIFMHLSPSSPAMGISRYSFPGVSIAYAQIGTGMDGSSASAATDIVDGGVIHIEARDDVEGGALAGVGDNMIGDLLESTGSGNSRCTSPLCADFYILVSERAGEGLSSGFADYNVLGVAHADSASDATMSFDSSANWTPLTSEGEVLYGHAVLPGPVIGAVGSSEFYSDGTSGPVASGMEMVEEGYMSERGSRLLSMSSDRALFSMAHRLGRCVWTLDLGL